jgi:glyoxylase-like metal-dependent hydrolase (beta-lactamase superfamily II)
MTAEFHVLTAGYAGERVAGTVSLLRDGATIVVVDPGMVASRRLILDPLRALGIEPTHVTDVVFSHHHPDHTLNAALFPAARYHDFWAIYQDDLWTDRDADGYQLSDSIVLMTTPGHTREDISTLAVSADGLIALTHVWWHEDGPAVDPRAVDQAMLTESRQRLLAAGPALIVPGHGVPFAPSDRTPS